VPNRATCSETNQPCSPDSSKSVLGRAHALRTRSAPPPRFDDMLSRATEANSSRPRMKSADSSMAWAGPRAQLDPSVF
jgi:hypothetical protein